MDNNKKAVIELQNVKREFVVGDETVPFVACRSRSMRASS